MLLKKRKVVATFLGLFGTRGFAPPCYPRYVSGYTQFLRVDKKKLHCDAANKPANFHNAVNRRQSRLA